MATAETQKVLKTEGFEVASVLQRHEGRPNVLDVVENFQVQLMLNTHSGSDAHADGRLIRWSALAYKIPLITTMAGTKATAAVWRSLQSETMDIKAIQDYHLQMQ